MEVGGANIIPLPAYSLKGSPLYIGEEAGWDPEPPWRITEVENICPETIFEPLIIQPVA
jgi:hypothetical protein